MYQYFLFNLHDEVVAILAKLFRTLRLDAIVEPMRCLFANAGEDASNQRPDIFISVVVVVGSYI